MEFHSTSEIMKCTIIIITSNYAIVENSDYVGKQCNVVIIPIDSDLLFVEFSMDHNENVSSFRYIIVLFDAKEAYARKYNEAERELLNVRGNKQSFIMSTPKRR